MVRSVAMTPHSERIALRRRFGPFEFNASTGELRKFGNRVRLQGQPIRILELLLSHPGDLVTREELQSLLWKDTAFVDSEHGLNAAVNKLRQALGDSADQPRYVETVPGRGYRFAGPLETEGRATLAEMPPPLVAPAAPPVRSWIPAAALTAACVIGAFGFWAGSRSWTPAPSPAAPVKFEVAAPRGFLVVPATPADSLALSPDGRHLAFCAVDHSGVSRAFVRDLATLEAREVAGSQYASLVFWSLNGREVYLIARGTLKRVSLGGQMAVEVGKVADFSRAGASLGEDRVLAGSWIKSFLFEGPIAKAQPQSRALPFPQLLPGTDRILFTAGTGLANRRAAVAGLYPGSRETTLFDTPARVVYTETPRGSYLLHLRGGGLIATPFDRRGETLGSPAIPVADKVSSFSGTGAAAFTASVTGGVVAYLRSEGRSKLAWVNRSGNVLADLKPAGHLKYGRISPDGNSVATAIYEVDKGYQDLWIFDIRTGEGRRLSSESSLRDGAVWSPDSRRLAYLRHVDKLPKVYVRGLGAGDPEEHLPGDGFQLPTDWSSDGRFLLYVNTGIPEGPTEQQSDVWISDRITGQTAPLLNTAFHEANGAFSPDGRWVAFTSDESGRPELYVQAFAKGVLSGPRFRASTGSAIALRWRRDGRELFYMGIDGRVQAVTVTPGAEPKFAPAVTLFTIPIDARMALHSITGFDVNADGTRFLIPVVDPAKPAPVIVVARDWDAR
jgi:eukaryotic-like serine/threonine-protein kinase